MDFKRNGGFLKGSALAFALLALFLMPACRSDPVSATGAASTAATTQMATQMESEPQTEAEYITQGLKVMAGGVDYTGLFTDGNAYSAMAIPASSPVVLESQTPFYSLYIIWDSAPGRYDLVWEGGQLSCGEYGFLHEYIPLQQPVSRVEFVFHEGQTHTPCDFYFLTEGLAPKDVQLWQPPHEQADILVFPTHADDDVLFFGPMMIYYAVEKGLKVQTAFMVDHIVFPIRGHERLNGLWEMGIRHYPVLGKAPDLESYSFLEAYYHYYSSGIEQWQVEQIRRFQPLVILGHDVNGEYGNSGHMINTYYLMKAVEAAADPESYPELTAKYGTWDTPKTYLHLYRENEMVFDVNVALQRDAAGRTPFEIASQAMSCHKSQLQWGFQVSQGEDRIYDCRLFGLYRSLVGRDTTADIMDNINPEDWRSEEKGK